MSRKTPRDQAEKFALKLFSEPEKREEFLNRLFESNEQPSLICIHAKPGDLPFELQKPYDRQPEFIARPLNKSEATKHEMHEKGAYYALDYSSVLECLPLLSIKIKKPTVLDLCAAPGGKSLFAWKALEPSLLLSNEVMQARLKILISTIKRCDVTPVKILSLAPQKLVARLENAADVILVDAPCTGQSLIAKKQSAPGAFHSHQINANAMRQRGIISSAAQMLRDGGYILYTTCTYAKEENEQIIEWFLKKHEGFETVRVDVLEKYQSEYSSKHLYRYWPSAETGAGGFSCLLKKSGETPTDPADLRELPHVWSAGL